VNIVLSKFISIEVGSKEKVWKKVNWSPYNALYLYRGKLISCHLYQKNRNNFFLFYFFTVEPDSVMTGEDTFGDEILSSVTVGISISPTK
jgi:hypothetical protein